MVLLVIINDRVSLTPQWAASVLRAGSISSFLYCPACSRWSTCICWINKHTPVNRMGPVSSNQATQKTNQRYQKLWIQRSVIKHIHVYFYYRLKYKAKKHLSIFDNSDNSIYDTSGLKWFSFLGMDTLFSDSSDTHFWEAGSLHSPFFPQLLFTQLLVFAFSASA